MCHPLLLCILICFCSFERGRLQYNPSRANAAFFEQIFSVEGRSRRGPLDPGGPLDHGGPLGPRLDSLDSRHGDSLKTIKVVQYFQFEPDFLIEKNAIYRINYYERLFRANRFNRKYTLQGSNIGQIKQLLKLFYKNLIFV